MDPAASAPVETQLPRRADLSTSLVARRGNRYLVVAILASLLMWNVPYGTYALYPFKIFATWLHEGSHAIVMLATGAGLKYLDLYRDTSGLAYPVRGVSDLAQGVISSAGYMGTALWGAVFLVVGRTPRGARVVCFALGTVMAVTGVWWVGNEFGMVATIAGGASLIVVGLWGSEGIRGFVVSLLAAQSCINAILDIRVLFAAHMYVNGQEYTQSDAHTAASVLGGPSWAWAAGWLAWSFVLFYVALRWARAREQRAATASFLAAAQP